MKLHRRPRLLAWILPVGVVILIVGHGIPLYYILSHMALSVVVVSSVIILVVIKHLGLLRPLYVLFRRRSRRSAR